MGIGAETLLTDHLSLKGEYRYTHFNGVSSFGAGDYWVAQGMKVGGIDQHQLRVVLSAKLY